jgi:TPR repeat protein
MAAGQDDEDAQRPYGEFFEDGCGVPNDINEALRYHELAVTSGNSSAQDDVD